jgi:hypothetical protein
MNTTTEITFDGCISIEPALTSEQCQQVTEIVGPTHWLIPTHGTAIHITEFDVSDLYRMSRHLQSLVDFLSTLDSDDEIVVSGHLRWTAPNGQRGYFCVESNAAYYDYTEPVITKSTGDIDLAALALAEPNLLSRIIGSVSVRLDHDAPELERFLNRITATIENARK